MSSTDPGTVNRNNQQVVRKTNLPGTDNLQFVYVVRCNQCSFEYGANGSDLWERKCPNCQGGKPGLSYK